MEMFLLLLLNDLLLMQQLATMAKHELSDSRRVESPSSPMVSSNPISPQDGPYAEAYVTLQSIGKGAFGFVKLAKRRTDGREVGGRKLGNLTLTLMLPSQIGHKPWMKLVIGQRVILILFYRVNVLFVLSYKKTDPLTCIIYITGPHI